MYSVLGGRRIAEWGDIVGRKPTNLFLLAFHLTQHILVNSSDFTHTVYSCPTSLVTTCLFILASIHSHSPS